jgi:hypothetical protein
LNRFYSDLSSYSATLPVYNTHAHQDLSLDQDGFTLDKLLRNSYVNWCGVPWDDSYDSRKNLLEKIRHNSYFLWTERALRDLYHTRSPLTADQWEHLSEQISQAHTRPGYWVDLLAKACKYEGIVLDAYWDPGSDWQLPNLFTPTFRVNSFFFGYHPAVSDHDGNNALRLYNQGEHLPDLDHYIDFMREKIVEKRRQGCVALKLPIAYDRSLDFTETSIEQASAAFERLKTDPQIQDIKTFQNYLFYEICHIAADLGIPIQVHTGMGKLERSNAIWLKEGIQKNPQTKFVLLHCSSPWIYDTIALVRTFPNTYPDLSWLPQLTSSGACRMIHDLIEAGAADKVCWGCDTWTPEESLGSLYAFRHVLSQALAEKIEEGYLGIEEAKKVVQQIMFENARNLYKRS